jgi:hypothetical protein
MEPEANEILQLELKYCERCGGLWLRMKGLADVYCSSCSAAVYGIVTGRSSRREPRLPIFRDLDSCGEFVPAMTRKEGRA